MSLSSNPNYKHRWIRWAPIEEDLIDLLAEAKSLQLAMDEVPPEDPEQDDLEEAYESVISRLRLFFYRAGLDPEMELRALS